MFCNECNGRSSCGRTTDVMQRRSTRLCKVKQATDPSLVWRVQSVNANITWHSTLQANSFKFWHCVVSPTFSSKTEKKKQKMSLNQNAQTAFAESMNQCRLKKIEFSGLRLKGTLSFSRQLANKEEIINFSSTNFQGPRVLKTGLAFSSHIFGSNISASSFTFFHLLPLDVLYFI